MFNITSLQPAAFTTQPLILLSLGWARLGMAPAMPLGGPLPAWTGMAPFRGHGLRKLRSAWYRPSVAGAGLHGIDRPGP